MKAGEAMKRAVWGAGTPRTMRAYWTLEELGLSYAVHPILPRTAAMDDPAFRRVSARGKIPILEDGDCVVGESGAIALHLADSYRDALALSPALGDAGRGRFCDLCFFAMTELDAASLYVIRRHAGLPEIYGQAPAATAAAADYFTRQLGEMERQLADGRAWLLGGEFSVADILLVTCIDWAIALRMSLPDVITAYQMRAAKRPAYRTAIEVNYTPLAKAAAPRP